MSDLTILDNGSSLVPMRADPTSATSDADPLDLTSVASDLAPLILYGIGSNAGASNIADIDSVILDPTSLDVMP